MMQAQFSDTTENGRSFSESIESKKLKPFPLFASSTHKVGLSEKNTNFPIAPLSF